MNRISLIIDGNHFMHTTLTAVGAFSKKNNCFDINNSEDENRIDINALLDRLSTIFSSDMRNFGSLIDEVVFAVDDSKPWRKDYVNSNGYLGLPNDLDYKGNRVKNKTINWNLIYSTFKHFLEGISEHGGVHVKSINGCEADDLIAGFSSYRNNNGKSVIIYSGDNDLKQCIGFNKSSDSFTIQYQKQQKGIFMDKETALFLKQNTNTILVNYLKSFVNNSKSKLKVIDIRDTLFDKVISGDSGDNILPVMSEFRKYKSGTKKGKTYESKISGKIVENIKTELDYKQYNVDEFYSDEFLQILANKCLKKYKTQNRKFNKDEVLNNLKTNVTLVILDSRSIPKPLYDSILGWVEKINIKNNLNNKFLSYNKNILNNLSLYDKRLSETASSAAIFKHLGI